MLTRKLKFGFISLFLIFNGSKSLAEDLTPRQICHTKYIPEHGDRVQVSLSQVGLSKSVFTAYQGLSDDFLSSFCRFCGQKEAIVSPEGWRFLTQKSSTLLSFYRLEFKNGNIRFSERASSGTKRELQVSCLLNDESLWFLGRWKFVQTYPILLEGYLEIKKDGSMILTYSKKGTANYRWTMHGRQLLGNLVSSDISEYYHEMSSSHKLELNMIENNPHLILGSTISGKKFTLSRL